MGFVNRLFLVLCLLAPLSGALPAFARVLSSAQIISACSMGAATCVSGAIDIKNIDDISIQAVWTGTAENGAFKLQASNDTGATVTTWTDLTGSSAVIAADGDFVWNVSNAGYRYLRLVYTKASGTGTLNATFTGKGWD